MNKFSGMLDYAELKNIAVEHSPHIIVAGFTAYPRIVDFKKFREITDACGALLMVDMSHFAGLVAGKQYPSPFEYADVVTTTTHKTLRGPRAAMIFSRHDRRAVSYDKKPGAALPVLIDKAIIPGIQGGPHNNQVAAVAVALREAATPVFKKYASQIIKNAHALSGELIKLGWHVISGGTDTHLILIDVYTTIRMSGKEASALLEKAGIIVNMNAVPHDQRSVIDPSGIRLGTAAETTRGKKEKDMIVIARKIDVVLRTEAK